jgi:hypothetical protein
MFYELHLCFTKVYYLFDLTRVSNRNHNTHYGQKNNTWLGCKTKTHTSYTYVSLLGKIIIEYDKIIDKPYLFLLEN